MDEVARETVQAIAEGPDVLAGSAWFPEGFEPATNEFKFVATSRAELAAQTFLDVRWNRAEARHTRANAAALTARLGSRLSQPRVIWHTGFCCSTLLARALDFEGKNLSLCEPQVLVDLADARRAGILSVDALSAATRLVFHLLARGFVPEELVTIKPSPAANPLVRQALLHPAVPMLFLFSDCRSFVISVFRLGETGRKYVRRLFLVMLRDGHPQQNWPPARLLALSDLELAAVVWHMQMAEFVRNWPRLGASRAASLDCDALLESPGEALCAVDRFLELGLGPDRVQKAAAGPLFQRNAKTGEQAFDAARRRDEYARVARGLGSDLDRIVAQSYAICGTTSVGAPLPAPLIALDKDYCR